VEAGFYYGTSRTASPARAVRPEGRRRRRRRRSPRSSTALRNGTFYEFEGPLYDQSGKLRVPKGKRLTVKDLYA
jgi:hypothetical protein